MGSVLDYFDCPICGNEASSDFYYKTGEEYIFCTHCGYKKEMTYQRNEDGNLITKDGTTNYAFDNLIWNEIEVKPKACYQLKAKESIGTAMGCLEDDEDIREFKEYVEKNKEQIEFAAISSYDTTSETIVIENLISNE